MRLILIALSFLGCVQQLFGSDRGETDFSRNLENQYKNFVQSAPTMGKGAYDGAVNTAINALAVDGQRAATVADWEVAAKWCVQDVARMVEKSKSFGDYGKFLNEFWESINTDKKTYSQNKVVMILASCTIYDELMKIKFTILDGVKETLKDSLSSCQNGANTLAGYMRDFFKRKYNEVSKNAPLLSEIESKDAKKFQEGALEFTRVDNLAFMHMGVPYKKDTVSMHFLLSQNGTVGHLPFKGSLKDFFKEFNHGVECNKRWISFLRKENMVDIIDGTTQKSTGNFFIYPANEALQKENEEALKSLEQSILMTNRNISIEKSDVHHDTFTSTIIYSDGKRKPITFHALKGSSKAFTKGMKIPARPSKERGEAIHRAVLKYLKIKPDGGDDMFSSDTTVLNESNDYESDTMKITGNGHFSLPKAF